MELELLTIFQNISIAGAVALVGYCFIMKVVSPLVNYFINKKNGNGTDLAGKVNEIETNHLVEINRRLECLDRNDTRTQEDLTNIRERLTRIETKLNIE